MKARKPLLTKPDIDWLIDSMKIVFPTKEESTDKFDKVMQKLDKFVGDIEAKRETQELHQGQHDQVDKRIGRVEKTLHLQPLVD